MKTKVCSKCGKHNSENARSCTDCGEVFSDRNLMDADNAQMISEVSKDNSADNPTPKEIQAPEFEDPKTENIHLVNYAAMLKEIRSWGLWLLGIGVLHIISLGFLNAPWGILLLIVGLASFYFRTAPMFIVYAVTLAWAALSNLVGFELGWVIFAFFQIFLSFRVFRQYRHFKNVESEYFKNADNDTSAAALSADRAARLFPWIGLLLSCSSIIGLFLIIIIVIIIAIRTNATANTPDYFVFIEGLIVNSSVLGISVSLSSLLSKFRQKALAIIGLVVGFLTLIIEVALLLL